MNICPKCGKEYSEPPALSRVDNETEICPLCGTKEALDVAGLIEGSSVREAILKASQTPYERTRRQVYATGNRWAIENFNETHN